VLRYAWDGVHILLTGDIERPAEAALAAAGDNIQAAVFKAPHHARDTSSSPPILEAVQPRYTVVSSAHSERHPGIAPPVAGRFADLGATVFRTDRHGAVLLTVTDGKVRWETARGLRGYPHLPPDPVPPGPVSRQSP